MVSINVPRKLQMKPFLSNFVACVGEKHLEHVTRIKELEQLSWFLFQVNYQEKEIFDQIVLQIDKCPTYHPYVGRNLINLVNILVKSGVVQHELISDLFTKANNFAPFQNSVIDINSCLDFLYGIFEKESKHHKSENYKVSSFSKKFF